MGGEKMSFGKLWDCSWATLRGNYWKSIAVLVIFGAVHGVLAGINFGWLSFLLGPLTIGLSFFFLQLARGTSPQIESIFTPFRNYGHYLWVYLRPQIFIFLWSLLLVIPGIIASFRYALTSYVALDEPELSAKAAMEKSCRLMKGHKLQLFGYGIVVSLLLFVAGLCTLGIAIFWFGPWTGAFLANFYLAVKAEAEAESGSRAEDSVDAQVQ